MSLSHRRRALTASAIYLCFIHSLVTLKETGENKHSRESQQRMGTLFSKHRLCPQQSGYSDGLCTGSFFQNVNGFCLKGKVCVRLAPASLFHFVLMRRRHMLQHLAVSRKSAAPSVFWQQTPVCVCSRSEGLELKESQLFRKTPVTSPLFKHPRDWTFN